MNTWVWVLTFTIMGSAPESGTFSKYKTRIECEEALVALKREKQQKNQQLAGTCYRALKT